MICVHVCAFVGHLMCTAVLLVLCTHKEGFAPALHMWLGFDAPRAPWSASVGLSLVAAGTLY